VQISVMPNASLYHFKAKNLHEFAPPLLAGVGRSKSSHEDYLPISRSHDGV
jgi:hypothetical protein